jgi:thiosulfate/3-mercaptopyruvate sulfurtransferase
MIQGIPRVKNFGANVFLKSSVLTALFMLFYLSPCRTAFAFNIGFIEPADLKKDMSGWVILDARPKSEWVSGHIPGALSFSWENYTRTDENGISYRVWPPEELAVTLGEMGIGENTPVVVYGDADKSWGGEGWNCWVLAWLGHKAPVRLLAGGIQSWKSNNFPLTEGQEKYRLNPVRYTYKIEAAIDITTSELKKQKDNIVLIDTRSFFERIKGKIPGSVHIEWSDFFNGKDRRPLSSEALKKLLRKNGVDANRQIVYYCTGGIRSAYAWLVHQLAGLPTAKNYEGGYEAWRRLSKNR